jgi:hypothetical protein
MYVAVGARRRLGLGHLGPSTLDHLSVAELVDLIDQRG